MRKGAERGRNESGGDVGGECMVRACAVFSTALQLMRDFNALDSVMLLNRIVGVLIQSEFDTACDDFRAKSSN